MHTLTGAFDVETSLLKVKSRKREKREKEEGTRPFKIYIYIERERDGNAGGKEAKKGYEEASTRWLSVPNTMALTRL